MLVVSVSLLCKTGCALVLEDGGGAQHGNDGAHAIVIVRRAAQLLAAQAVRGYDLARTVSGLAAYHGLTIFQ